VTDRRLRQPVRDGIFLRHGSAAFAAFVLATLIVCYGAIAQSRTRRTAESPSLDLQGTGMLVPTSSACDANGTCLGMLTAALTGQPSAASLSMVVSLNDTPIPNSPFGSPPCYITNGSGTLGTFGVNFEGKLCLVDFFQYTLSGTLSRGIPSDKICQAAPATVLAGQLTAFGANSPSGAVPPPGFNPIPAGASGAIVNIIGSVGQIPDPCPSP
jgi:hypothetical protein